MFLCLLYFLPIPCTVTTAVVLPPTFIAFHRTVAAHAPFDRWAPLFQIFLLIIALDALAVILAAVRAALAGVHVARGARVVLVLIVAHAGVVVLVAMRAVTDAVHNCIFTAVALRADALSHGLFTVLAHEYCGERFNGGRCRRDCGSIGHFGKEGRRGGFGSLLRLSGLGLSPHKVKTDATHASIFVVFQVLRRSNLNLEKMQKIRGSTKKVCFIAYGFQWSFGFQCEKSDNPVLPYNFHLLNVRNLEQMCDAQAWLGGAMWMMDFYEAGSDGYFGHCCAGFVETV